MIFLKNYFSSLLLIVVAYIVYTNTGFHPGFIWGSVSIDIFSISFPVIWVLYWVACAYIILLIPFYIVYPQASKARITLWYFKKVLWGAHIQTQSEKTALLAIIVKLFFIPLMLVWLTNHIANMINNLVNSYGDIALFSSDFLMFFNTHFFWTAFSLILFVDVLFFTLWYLLEAPFLKNTIKSVEPTIIGWAVVILCYPPFNNITSNFISWYSTDFPSFANPYIHITLNIIILVLMAIYAWASWALWLKASNLTNRGIVTSGPYKYIRHPAYICKNTAWLIWGIPIVYLALTTEQYSLISVMLWLSTWACIYYLRAMTEEHHLSADPDYVAYKKQVPYKFIPKIW